MKSLYQRVKNKTPRDFIVYGQRKIYLKKIQFLNKHHGEDYFFSKAYLKNHLSSDVLANMGIDLKTINGGLFGNIEVLKRNMEQLKNENSELVNSAIAGADEIINHQFDLLGSGDVNLSFPTTATGILNVKLEHIPNSLPRTSYLFHNTYKPLDWHCDFKSGYRWEPSKFYPSSRDYVEHKGADIKTVWELSRCQQLGQLAVAYLLTGEDCYADEVLSQIIDWIINNPLCKGPNWNCPMDVGIRAANWLVSLEIIQQHKTEYRDEILAKIHASLVQHVDYLSNNFEWTSKLTSNHFLSNISGLFFCSVYLKGLKRRSKYLNFLKREFEVEIFSQTYSDGMNSEGSLPYHRLVLELFAYSGLLAERSGIAFEQSFYERLRQSFKFTEQILRPNESVPQIGDNDSGLFFKFINRSLLEQKYLLSIGAALFLDVPEKTSLESNVENVLLSCHPRVKSASETNAINVCHFAESGLALIRSEDMFFSFYNGSNGQKGNGGHCHNDRNSITLMWKGKSILEDAGSGLYTPFPDIRNKFRATESHNTVSVNKLEQNLFFNNGYLFGITENITENVILLKNDEDRVVIEGQHNGYSRLGDGHVHKRTINYDMSNNIEIVDQFKNVTTDKYAYFLIPYSRDLISTDGGVESNLFKLDFYNFESIMVDRWDYSPSYGVITSDYFLRVKVHFYSQLTTNIKLK